MPLQSNAVKNGRKTIDQRYRLSTYDTLRHLGSCHDHRYTGGFLIHGRLAPQSAGAKVVTVIARVNDTRLVNETRFFQYPQQPSDLVVNEADQTKIGRD